MRPWPDSVVSRGVLAAFCLLLACLPAGAAEFVRVGDLVQGRDMGMAATLPDGRVLVTGGVGLDAQGNGVYLASAELFDPATDTFAPTGAMRQGRDGNAVMVPLADGRVLVAGGISQDADGQTIALASAEVYDPTTGRFHPTANDMSSVRYFHAAARLRDGRVLITGGWGDGQRLASADLYDPATNRFTRVGDMSIERNAHTASTLPDGRVLIAGGLTTDAEIVSSAELFDPATGRFQRTGSLAGLRMMATASNLANGRPLILGGMDYSEWRPAGEIYNPATGRFTTTAALLWPRADHAQTTLTDGRVLVTGGVGADEGDWRAERYDPGKRRFDPVANLGLGRGRAATALLHDGRVLVAGGVRPWEPPLAYAEVYVPTRTPGPYPDLALSIRSSSSELRAGRPFRYTLTLRNDGKAAARDAGLQAELPPDVAIVRTRVIASPSAGAWRCDLSGSTLRCAPGDGAPLPPRADPQAPVPTVSVLVDAVAPNAPGTVLFVTALAGTSTVEDITGNNEAVSAAFVYGDEGSRAGAAGGAPQSKVAAPGSVRPDRADPVHGLRR